jgi:hypothetical protein
VTAAKIVRALRDRGVTLAADGNQLRFRGPKGAVTPRLLQELRDRKAEVLEFLRGSARRPWRNRRSGRFTETPCKCGSGLSREQIWVKEFGWMVNCRQCREQMVRSIREAAGDPEPEFGLV